MPKEAVKRGAVDMSVPLDQFAREVVSFGAEPV
jgi:chemotaxis response regulator CheB